MAKYIFVTGGVVSGLGKGVTSASLGLLLESAGQKVVIQKLDPYLNVDCGTINPYQHGEVFVTADGAETDLDLGHYERFLCHNLTAKSNVTAGKVYYNVIKKEREGAFLGETVQVIPHITNEIINSIIRLNDDQHPDVNIIEIGGTVGDIESTPFLEAIRQFKNKFKDDVIVIHVALLPYLNVSQELKTKPIQHSCAELLKSGIAPDMLVVRSDHKISNDIRKKISLFCNVNYENIIATPDAKTIYQVPITFKKQNVLELVDSKLNLKLKTANLDNLKSLLKKIANKSNQTLKISIVGKYTDLPDSYLSVLESLKLGAAKSNCKLELDLINASDLTADNVSTKLKKVTAMLVPGGFGVRGTEEIILAIRYARENKIPFFGICLGMQLACIEFAQNVCNLKTATSTEFNPKADIKLFDILKTQKEVTQLGGTLRLGESSVTILKDSLAYKLYNKTDAIERHRHRYEFNNEYRDSLENMGLLFSGIYEKLDLVEIVEIEHHPFFIGCQFHPEFLTKLNYEHPLFKGFIEAAIKNSKSQ